MADQPSELHLAPWLDIVEQALEKVDPQVEMLQAGVGQRIKEYAASLGVSFESPHMELIRPILILAFVVLAFQVPTNLNFYHYGTKYHTWVFEKMALLKRAQLLALHVIVDDSMQPGAEERLVGPSSTWLRAFRQRWPHAYILPRRVLRSLGCSTGNVSLTSMFSLQELPSCLEDLAVFHTGKWRRKQEADIFTQLIPHLRVRPMFLGQGIFTGMLNYTLENYVFDPSGLFLEFGVFSGFSLNLIARRVQALGGGKVYGFDSFQGLPEPWLGSHMEGNVQADTPAGFFKVPELPSVEHNVELVVGYFNETLPAFLESASDGDVVRFMHLDADLYSSTREVFTAVGSLLRPGSIIVVDDIVNFPSFREHGLRAFAEFFASHGAPERLEVLGAPWDVLEVITDPNFEIERSVAFRIL